MKSAVWNCLSMPQTVTIHCDAYDVAEIIFHSVD